LKFTLAVGRVRMLSQSHGKKRNLTQLWLCGIIRTTQFFVCESGKSDLQRVIGSLISLLDHQS